MDARYLKRYQRALGGLYQTVLRAELTARYGVEWGPVVQGQAEIAAVPAVVVEAFSKRTGQVDALLPGKIAEFTVRNGRAPTGYEHAALVRQAALDSRAAKTGLVVGDLTRDWAAQAVALGWDRDRLARTVVPAGQIRDALARAGGLGVLGATRGWVDELGVAGGVFDQVTAMVTRASTWHRGDVLRAITDLAVPPVGVGGDRWAHLLEETADRFLVGRCLSLDPPPAGRVRGSDGRGVRLDPMIGAYTTAAILAQEEHLVTWTLDHTPDMPTLSGSTPRVLESGTRLDPDQHTAARVVAGGDRLVFVIGPAGTGKTSTLAVAVVDLEAQGRRVVGVAPSNQAAHVLQAETGMPADSVAKLLFEHQRPEGPPVGWRYPAGTTVVVDEAGMLNTGDLAQLVGLVDRYGWRLVLVGDPYQLAAVGRGGMFTELARHANPVELTRVRRFTQEWEGPASLALRHGDLGVVGTYEHHGRVTIGTFDDHVEHATRVWFAETRVGRTVAITAAIMRRSTGSTPGSRPCDSPTGISIRAGWSRVGEETGCIPVMWSLPDATSGP